MIAKGVSLLKRTGRAKKTGAAEALTLGHMFRSVPPLLSQVVKVADGDGLRMLMCTSKEIRNILEKAMTKEQHARLTLPLDTYSHPDAAYLLAAWENSENPLLFMRLVMMYDKGQKPRWLLMRRCLMGYHQVQGECGPRQLAWVPSMQTKQRLRVPLLRIVVELCDGELLHYLRLDFDRDVSLKQLQNYFFPNQHLRDPVYAVGPSHRPHYTIFPCFQAADGRHGRFLVNTGPQRDSAQWISFAFFEEYIP